MKIWSLSLNVFFYHINITWLREYQHYSCVWSKEKEKKIMASVRICKTQTSRKWLEKSSPAWTVLLMPIGWMRDRKINELSCPTPDRWNWKQYRGNQAPWRHTWTVGSLIQPQFALKAMKYSLRLCVTIHTKLNSEFIWFIVIIGDM